MYAAKSFRPRLAYVVIKWPMKARNLIAVTLAVNGLRSKPPIRAIWLATLGNIHINVHAVNHTATALLWPITNRCVALTDQLRESAVMSAPKLSNRRRHWGTTWWYMITKMGFNVPSVASCSTIDPRWGNTCSANINSLRPSDAYMRR